MIVFLIVILSLVGEFLHQEYLVKHPNSDEQSLTKVRMISIEKELILGYVIIATLITRLSHLTSIVIAFFVFWPVALVLHLHDTRIMPVEKEGSADQESERERDLEANDSKKATPLKLDSNRILPSSLTKFDPDSEFKEAPSGSNLLSGRDSILDSNAKLHNSARHEQPFHQVVADQENIIMNSRMSQLSQIEEEDLRVDRRRVLGEINFSNDQNIARSRRNTNRSSQ